MKLLFADIFVILVSAQAGQGTKAEDEYMYFLDLGKSDAKQGHMYFPDGNGEVHLIDLEDDTDDLDKDLERGLEHDVMFYLYTRQNPREPEVLTPHNAEALHNSYWDNAKPTRILTHGWKSNSQSASCTTIRDAHLFAADYNVIVVDWGNVAAKLYLSASRRVPNVAGRIAKLIDFLAYEGGLDLKNTCVIGHSLGAHVMGIAAHKTNGTIGNVVGLDPAGPLFSSGMAGDRIHRTDGDHVQIIHTNAGHLGLSESIGHSDFYPNGGSRQPGCGMDLTGSCSHGRSYLYFAESIQNPMGFPSTPMQIMNLFPRIPVYMGGCILSSHARGSYTLETEPNPPFALG